jgi:hypothetical protein
LLERDSVHSNFRILSAEPVEEIAGTAYVGVHEPTGARLLWLANKDDNKAFSIAFKTPPANDTGVFHILEHSVLCGSEKYPVKEPFVNLLKTSMQTFLNALTFSDKTMYPVASTNEADLTNLMSVYLDAVFHPAIYTRPDIFKQEGWHYELDEPEEPITLNGVVFNEMRGALSDPDENLFMGLNRALFPDTCYRFESGGDPHAIPELTYEEFIETHAAHYRPDNAYVVLYGNLDIEEKLAFLDRELTAVEPAPGAPNSLELQAPVKAGHSSMEMATTPDNACVGLAYVFARAQDRDRVLAADILLDTLMGSNEAPLKRALLDADLANDASAYLIDGIAQPMVVFELRGAKPGVAEKFRALVESTCANLAENGIERERLEASLSQAEFNMREGDFGYPDGVGLAICALSGWLYDDDSVLSYIRYEDAFKKLRAGLETHLFEDLLRSMIIDSNHDALVEVVPVEKTDAAAEAEKLAAYKASLDVEQIDALVDDTLRLHEEQAAPDAPEDLAKLPMLGLDQIGDMPAEPDVQTYDETPVPCRRYELDTHNICYVNHYFDLSNLTFEELPYASIAASLLGKLDTAAHTASELDMACEEALGSLSYFIETYGDPNDALVAKPKLTITSSALVEKVADLAALPAEIWTSTDFSDTDRIRDILTQRKLSMEQAFTNSGHAAGLARVSSYYTASGVVGQACSGIDFYQFLKGLLADFDSVAETLPAKLSDICAKVFKRESTVVSFAGSDDACRAYWSHVDPAAFGPASAEKRLVVPAPVPKREGFVIPSNVCYVEEGALGTPVGARYSGSWIVAGRALSLTYLWNEVRVLGGAYGCGFSCNGNSMLAYYSYRDPAVDPTVERFAASAQWLAKWEPTQKDLDGFIISSVAGIDAPAKPRVRARSMDGLFFNGREPGWRKKIRGQIIATTLEDVEALAKPLGEAGCGDVICVLGGKDILEAAKTEFEIKELVSGE